MSQICPRFGRERHEKNLPGDIIDQPPDGISWNRGKLAELVGDDVVISPERAVEVKPPGTKTSNYLSLAYSFNDFRMVSIEYES